MIKHLVCVTLQAGIHVQPWRGENNPKKEDAASLRNLQPVTRHIRTENRRATEGRGAGAQNGFPWQPRHHPGPHPAVACDQRWHRDVRDGPDRPRRGSGEVPFVCAVRWRRLIRGFVWGQQRWRRWPDLRSLSVCRHHLQLGLWYPTALQHRQVTVWLSEFAAFWALNPASWCGWYR